MTDNEIIKALECCCFTDDENNCCTCPLSDDSGKLCVGVLVKNALDLINRQQAEIERLQKGNDELGKAIAGAYELNCFLEATRKIVRVEAIKEFAERLKEQLVYCETVLEGYGATVTNVGYKTEDVNETIDNLVKEMVGEDETT